MATFWELYNYEYLKKYDLDIDESSLYPEDHEILIEVDGELCECEINESHDGKLVLEVEL